MDVVISLPQTLLDEAKIHYQYKFANGMINNNEPAHDNLEHGTRRRIALGEVVYNLFEDTSNPEIPAQYYVASRLYDHFTLHNIWNVDGHPAALPNRNHQGPFPGYIKPFPWLSDADGRLIIGPEYVLPRFEYVPAIVEIVQRTVQAHRPEFAMVMGLLRHPTGHDEPVVLSQKERDYYLMPPPHREGGQYSHITSLSKDERTRIVMPPLDVAGSNAGRDRGSAESSTSARRRRIQGG